MCKTSRFSGTNAMIWVCLWTTTIIAPRSGVLIVIFDKTFTSCGDGDMAQIQISSAFRSFARIKGLLRQVLSAGSTFAGHGHTGPTVEMNDAAPLRTYLDDDRTSIADFPSVSRGKKENVKHYAFWSFLFY